MLVLAMAASLLVSSAIGATASDAFPDVDDDHPFHDEISWLADNNITTGYDDGEFKATRPVSRQATVAFLHRLAGAPEGPFPDPEFDDVDDDHPFFLEISWGVATGLVEGYEDNAFRSAADVSRQAIAAWLHRVAGAPEGPFPDPEFDDVDDDHPFLLEISWLATRDVTTGFPDGEFKSVRAATRQAMAAFLFRFATEDFDGVELSWFDEVSTEPGEAFGEDDVFATGDAGEAGDNGAEGSADLSLDAGANAVHFEVEYSEVEGPFADGPGLHIHAGDRDQNGPVVVFLATGDELDDHAEDGVITGTVTVDRDDFDVLDIINDPDEFYVNLHSDDFPAGAIRGQLPDGPPSIADEDITSTWQLHATSDEVVDGGQLGAEATFELTFDSTNNVVCYDIVANNLVGGYESPAHTSTHIHQGDEGETGPPRVAFRNPEGALLERTSAGCHSVPQQTNTGDPDNGVGFDLAEIEDNPQGFYVDIHTDEHPEGAVRAQFERAEEFEDIELSWLHEVSTEPGEPFGEEDVFATGDAGPAGLNGADGSADLTVNATDNSVTFEVEYAEVDGPFGDGPGLHIHEGDRDQNGPVVVFLATGDELDDHADDGLITGTVTVDRDDFDVQDIIDDPDGYYINLHSDEFPAGAIRGQLPDGPPSIAEEDITSEWTVEADAVQVPNGGELGAEAVFELIFDSTNNVICYEITSDGVSGGYESPAHTSTHIHQGDEGETGPPRVIFRNPTPLDDGDPDGERASHGCHRVPQDTNTGDPDNGVGFDLAEIEDNPQGFYVDIHTDNHPEGAVRGQFELVLLG